MFQHNKIVKTVLSLTSTPMNTFGKKYNTNITQASSPDVSAWPPGANIDNHALKSCVKLTQ